MGRFTLVFWKGWIGPFNRKIKDIPKPSIFNQVWASPCVLPARGDRVVFMHYNLFVILRFVLLASCTPWSHFRSERDTCGAPTRSLFSTFYLFAFNSILVCTYLHSTESTQLTRYGRVVCFRVTGVTLVVNSQHYGWNGEEFSWWCELDAVIHLFPVSKQAGFSLVWCLKRGPLYRVKEDVHGLE